MNLMSIGVGALCGIVAALVARMMTGGGEDRGGYGKAFLISFLVIYGLTRLAVQPKLESWYATRTAETELQKIPAFRAIKKYDSQTYDAVLGEIKQAALSGGSKSDVLAITRAHMTKLVMKRLPSASNESVATYMKVTMSELDELSDRGGDLCYKFLFPQGGAPLEADKLFSKQTQEADLSALAKVIETSATDPQPVPSQSDVMPHLQPIIGELTAEHGNDVALMQNPAAATQEPQRRKICAMTASLYDKILRLPTDQSGMVLRYMISGT